MNKEPVRLTPSCREAHRLVSEGMDRPLSLVERTRVQMHLMICEACTNFNGQMALLRKAIRHMPPSPQDDDDNPSSAE
ncbi:MAG: zf-HC2 domain-containing protein [Pseudomonadota bacterium]